MHSTFVSTPPDRYRVLTQAEVFERYPALYELREEWEWDEDAAEDPVVVLSGNHHLTQDWRDWLKDNAIRTLLIEGDVRLDFQSRTAIWTTGAVHGSGLSLTAYDLLALGPIHSAAYASLMAEDHEMNRTPPRATVYTPYLFSWFHHLDTLTLSPDTLVCLLTDWDYCQALDHDNPVLTWHDAMFALRDEVQQLVVEHYHDAPCWDISAIGDHLRQGQPIVREGFDPAALALQREGDEAFSQGKELLGWLYYREAARLAPAYAPLSVKLGQCLYLAGAYRQALPYLQQAANAFPARQYTLYNEGAFLAGATALRLDLPRLAADLVGPVIEAAGQYAHANLLRVRAEAYLLLSDPARPDYEADSAASYREQAIRDIEAGLAHQSDHGTLNWLMAAHLWRQGRRDEADSYRCRAIARAGEFDRPLDERLDTAFLSKPLVEVDWENQRLEDHAPRRDQHWWRKLVLRHPSRIRRAPMAERTPALLEALLKRHPRKADLFAPHFPPAAYSAESARQLVSHDASYLAYLPDELISREICLAAAPDTGPLPIRRLPAALLDREVCLHLLRCQVGLSELPASLLDRALCEAAIRLDSEALFAVPAALQDDELWLLALACGGTEFVQHHIPSDYKTAPMLQRALSLDKAALDSIPGHLFDAELYRHAEALYGQDPDWPEIVAAHQAAACLGRNIRYGLRCWLVFWDKESMLNKLRNGPREQRLKAEEIPPAHFDEQLALACFNAEPAQLHAIPPQFLNDSMARKFIGRYPDRLRHLPLALRSVAVCLTALRADPSQADEVPAAHYAEVFNGLLAKPSRELPHAWLLLERGRGYLMQQPAALAKAQADFQSLPSATNPAIAATASFLLGYCHHLQGQHAEAAAALQAAGSMAPVDDYAHYHPARNKARSDFDHRAVRDGFDDAYRLSSHRTTYAKAWEYLCRIERLLREADQHDALQWAELFNLQCWLSIELERREEHHAICRAAWQRLSPCTLWPSLRADDPIREVLRFTALRLAEISFEQASPPSLTELEDSLARLDLAMALCEYDKTLRYPLYDSYLRTLLALAASHPHHQQRCQQVCAEVLQQPWRRFIEHDEVWEVLKQAETAAKRTTR
ncbi:hypothetical protein [Chitinimonas lacunae]|uniref:Tetratricopeptide repeat protein n=1 Tax=Chitinimonas lacunae TaxID=1963018 RepID=A0ABV8MRH1_9NEIS